MPESILGSLGILLVLVVVAAIFLALLLLPFLIFFKMGASANTFHKRVRTLANQKGWQTSAKSPALPLPGTPFPLAGPLPNGQTWTLDALNYEEANCLWTTILPSPQPAVRIENLDQGRFLSVASSGLERYRTVGSTALQKKYFTAATNEQVLHRLLSPAVESFLLSWPTPKGRQPRLSILVKHTAVKIYAVLGTRDEDFERMVALGTAVATALSAEG